MKTSELLNRLENIYKLYENQELKSIILELKKDIYNENNKPVASEKALQAYYKYISKVSKNRPILQKAYSDGESTFLTEGFTALKIINNNNVPYMDYTTEGYPNIKRLFNNLYDKKLSIDRKKALNEIANYMKVKSNKQDKIFMCCIGGFFFNCDYIKKMLSIIECENITFYNRMLKLENNLYSGIICSIINYNNNSYLDLSGCIYENC